MHPPGAASDRAARAYVEQMDQQSRVLHRQDGLRYLLARPENGPAIARILARSFVHEPMSRAVGLSQSTLVFLELVLN